MNSNEKCPICNGEATISRNDSKNFAVLDVKCKACSSEKHTFYRIELNAIIKISKFSKECKGNISRHIQEDNFEITDDDIIYITENNITKYCNKQISWEI